MYADSQEVSLSPTLLVLRSLSMYARVCMRVMGKDRVPLCDPTPIGTIDPRRVERCVDGDLWIPSNTHTQRRSSRSLALM